MSEKRPGIDLVIEYLKSCDRPMVVDLGAHTGKTTQIWLDAGARHVVAVEPYRASFALLEQRFGNNDHVTLMSCAVGLAKRDMPLYTPDKFKGKDRSQGCTLFRAALKDKKHKGRLTDYGKHLVSVKQLSDVLLGQCDLLKVNTQRILSAACWWAHQTRWTTKLMTSWTICTKRLTPMPPTT